MVAAMGSQLVTNESAAIISNLQSKYHAVASEEVKPRWQRTTVLTLALS